MDDYMELERYSLDGNVLYDDLVRESTNIEMKIEIEIEKKTIFKKKNLLFLDWCRLVEAKRGLQGQVPERRQLAEGNWYEIYQLYCYIRRNKFSFFSDGQQFHPDLSKDERIWVFQMDICRTLYAEFTVCENTNPELVPAH